MPRQLAFHIDTSSCTACKACQAACKDKNGLPVGILWRRVLRYEGGEWMPHPAQPGVCVPVGVFAYSVSAGCMHCQDPICVTACPTGAMRKRDDGIVLVDGDTCSGCRDCMEVCPFGAPQYDERRAVVSKCDFCSDLLQKGESPACVAACPTRALGYGELDELRRAHGALEAIEPLPASPITRPSVVITPHKDACPSGAGGGFVANLAEEMHAHDPLASAPEIGQGVGEHERAAPNDGALKA